MEKSNEKLCNEAQNPTFSKNDVSGSAIVENEQVVLYFQFDDDEPIEALKCNGKKFTMEILPVENNFITLTDGKKTMKLFVRHCH